MFIEFFNQITLQDRDFFVVLSIFVSGILIRLYVIYPPSQGICSLLPLHMLNDKVEVSLIERLSEPTLGDRVGNCWGRGIWVKLFKLLDVLFGVQDALRRPEPSQHLPGCLP